jgi:hypothetical protein
MELNYNDIFNLPKRCLVNKRLTKTFFSKNFDLSSSEKKVLNDEIVKMEWIGSLKPSNSNIPKFESEKYLFEEVQIMSCEVVNLQKVYNLISEIFQKYIPYQIVLIIENSSEWILSLSDKRINLNDRTKRTVERYVHSPVLSKSEIGDFKFLRTITFDFINKSNLQSVYQSYINSVIQLKSSLITGVFNEENLERTEESLKIIQTIEKIESEIISLKNQIKSESQLNFKVSLNVEIQTKKREIKRLKETLSQ